jgi:hypothetical protein
MIIGVVRSGCCSRRAMACCSNPPSNARGRPRSAARLGQQGLEAARAVRVEIAPQAADGHPRALRMRNLIRLACQRAQFALQPARRRRMIAWNPLGWIKCAIRPCLKSADSMSGSSKSSRVACAMPPSSDIPAPGSSRNLCGWQPPAPGAATVLLASTQTSRPIPAFHPQRHITRHQSAFICSSQCARRGPNMST